MLLVTQHYSVSTVCFFLSEGPKTLFHALHFDWFLLRQFSPICGFALRGGRGAFCHKPKETGGVMLFTQGACLRGGGDFSLLLKSNRQEEEGSRQGGRERMAAAIYLKGFTPVC